MFFLNSFYYECMMINDAHVLFFRTDKLNNVIKIHC